MREFGSDFHYIDSYNSKRAHLTDVYRGAILLADGRQCVVVLIRQNGWKRIWVPDYYCYEVINTIKLQTGVEVAFYEDNPLEEGLAGNLRFENGDVLLRVNFFGMRSFRSNNKIDIPVIEDHSHDLFGHWALYSDADWCVSSLRKSLPLPEGGMMWSPKGHRLTMELLGSYENERIAAVRWNAMELKARYIDGDNIEKGLFRREYTETESWFDTAEPTLIDKRSRKFVSEELDVNLWLSAKRKNWKALKSLVDRVHSKVIVPEHESCSMFSLVLLLDSSARRDAVQKKLVDYSVYPAILWTVPDSASSGSRDFSKRMLSIHCDGRYSEMDMYQLASILNEFLK